MMSWLGALLALGCGDEEPCEGAACHAVGFDSPEGGEIRVEYVRTPTAEFSRGIAFFKTSQTPESTPFLEIGAASASLCNDLTQTPRWPTAPHDAATYLDVGALSVTGGGRTIPLEKTENYTDFLGRVHGVAYHFMDTTTMISPATLYDVVASGGAEAEAMNWPAALGVPQQFALGSPALPLTLSIPRGEDFVITWEDPAETIAQDVLGLIAFQDAEGTLTQICVTAEDLDGFTVPRDFLAKIPAKGTLLRGHTTHVLKEFPDGRRFDVIGTWCYATPYIAT
jgi:hypothetical protein